MKRSEALDLLQLQEGFDTEQLRLNYHEKFVLCYRELSAAVTIEDSERKKTELHELNKAYSEIEGQDIIDSEMLQFDFRFKNFDRDEILNDKKKSMDEIAVFVQKMMNERREGLALSLLEKGISLSAMEQSNFAYSNLRTLIPLLGELLIELGLTNQGMKYLNFGKTSYKKALNYIRIGDYKMAAHHFALELKLSESGVGSDEICREISLCYFLLNDYENATNIIEEVLPRVVPKRQIFEENCKEKDFAIAMMVSIYKLNDYRGKILDEIKIRLKYPLCFKYLVNCFGKIENAWKIVLEFERDNKAYDKFMSGLKPKSSIRKKVDMSYDLDEISEIHLHLFEVPIKKSLIYHPNRE